MANQKHLDMLKQGIKVWNKWKSDHTDIEVDLRGAKLGGARLVGVNLSRVMLSEALLMNADLRDTQFVEADLTGAFLMNANLGKSNLNRAKLGGANFCEANLIEASLIDTDLSWADLSQAKLIEAKLNRANLNKACLIGTYLSGADFVEANLMEANLNWADLSRAKFRSANLSGAKFSGADLTRSDLSNANLSGADLSRAILVETNLTDAILTNSRIYGISAWNMQLEGTQQFSLIITPEDQPTITVDNLEMAQFIYLLLNNKKIRDVIDTITSKVVLILGRFTPQRKAVLDALKDELRKKDYLPIVFDFDKPDSRDVTETVMTLAHLSRFIIADLTDPKSIPQELAFIIPSLPSVPVQPLIHISQREYGMFEHFTRFPWVLPIFRYIDQPNLLQSLKERVISPAEQKTKELTT